VIGFPVLDIFLSDWYHYQCMGHISVVTTAKSCYSTSPVVNLKSSFVVTQKKFATKVWKVLC